MDGITAKKTKHKPFSVQSPTWIETLDGKHPSSEDVPCKDGSYALLALSADGKRVYATAFRHVAAFELETGKIIGWLDKGDYRSNAYGEPPEEDGDVVKCHRLWIKCIAVSSCDKYLVTVGVNDPKPIFIWSTESLSLHNVMDSPFDKTQQPEWPAWIDMKHELMAIGDHLLGFAVYRVGEEVWPMLYRGSLPKPDDIIYQGRGYFTTSSMPVELVLSSESSITKVDAKTGQITKQYVEGNGIKMLTDCGNEYLVFCTDEDIQQVKLWSKERCEVVKSFPINGVHRQNDEDGYGPDKLSAMCGTEYFVAIAFQETARHHEEDEDEDEDDLNLSVIQILSLPKLELVATLLADDYDNEVCYPAECLRMTTNGNAIVGGYDMGVVRSWVDG
jgi:hypothetical protein